MSIQLPAPKNPAQTPGLQIEYEYLAFQINREDALVNYRMTWTLQLNGFLFAALAVVGKEVADPYRNYFSIALPLIGLATTLAGLVGIAAAQVQLNYLKGRWSEERYGTWPRPFGDPIAFSRGKFPAYGPLWALIVAWAAFLGYWLLRRSAA